MQLGNVLNFCLKDFSFGWRICIGVEVAVGALLALGMLFFPRSPRSHDHMQPCGLVHVHCLSLYRWLVKSHRDEQARRVLTKIYGDESRAQAQLEEIQSTAGSAKEPFVETLKYVSQWKILQRY